jgi:hypothetical protein
MISQEQKDKFKVILTNDIINSFNTRKDHIIRYIQKHFKLNENYIINKNCQNQNKKVGRPQIDYILTEETFNLIKNSYKLRQIELGKKSFTHPILISIETATIGFIFDVFKNYKIEKQYIVDNYRIDLYFVDLKLAIECDEDWHRFTKTEDKIRQEHIENKLNCKFYRYNPCENDFKLANVIADLIELTK